MGLPSKRNPYQELVEPANEEFLGHINGTFWARVNPLAVLAEAASLVERVPERYSGLIVPGRDAGERLPEEFRNATVDVIHRAFLTSASIQGKRSDQLTQAIMGRQPPAVGLAIPGSSNQENGQSAQVQQQRRGL